LYLLTRHNYTHTRKARTKIRNTLKGKQTS